MRTTTKLAALLLLIVFTISFPAGAQVTIGSDIPPEDGSLLQLKQTSDDANGVNSTKGLGLPRVSLTKQTALFPMYETTPGSGVANSDYDDATKKAKLDKDHTGLTVYNVNTTAPFSDGVYTWDGSTWMEVSGVSASTNPIRRLYIPIGRTITTETYAYYGTMEFSVAEPDIDDYALVNVVPIVFSNSSAPNFVPDNLFFSTSMRREDDNTVIWKLKIENRNTKSEAGLSALIDGVYVLYTTTGGTFEPVQLAGEPDGVYVTEIPFIGLGSDPNQ
jgi:hypothetical protein